MRDSDRAEFCRILTGLSAIKPGKQLTPEGLEVYFNALEDWSIEDFKAAASHLAKSCEFMPNPYHFEQLRRAAKPTAAEAWAEAIEHAAHGGYRGGPLGDALIDTCVRALGGYKAIAMCDEDKLHFLERRFCEHFETKMDAEEARDALPDLTDSRPMLEGPQPVAAQLERRNG